MLWHPHMWSKVENIKILSPLSTVISCFPSLYMNQDDTIDCWGNKIDCITSRLQVVGNLTSEYRSMPYSESEHQSIKVRTVNWLARVSPGRHISHRLPHVDKWRCPRLSMGHSVCQAWALWLSYYVLSYKYSCNMRGEDTKELKSMCMHNALSNIQKYILIIQWRMSKHWFHFTKKTRILKQLNRAFLAMGAKNRPLPP